MNIIIIANGIFPTLPPVLKLINEADSVICCDGALANYLHWFRQQASRPTHDVAVVGDGDSLSPALLREAMNEGIGLHHQEVSEQEYNDLTKAVRYAMRHADGNGNKIGILGATGKREDHTLGNISLLMFYAEQFPGNEFYMPSDYGTFHTVDGERSFDSFAGQQVSIIALDPAKPLSVEGLLYPIQNRCLTQWWQGTLNESLGDSFTIKGDKLLVYLKR